MVLRLLHLTGSPVDDFFGELSRLYARDCLEATRDAERYESVVAWISPDGRWRFPADLSGEAIAAAPSMTVADAIAHVLSLGIDVMVPQLFCLPGMTVYRGLFDVLGIPYVGNPPDVMALGAHKARARAVVAAAGVRVPEGEVLRRGETPTIPVPAVVKPVDADNSAGISLVRDDFAPALAAAFEHADEVLVEAYVELGREVRCGVLERDGELICLPLEEYAVDAATHPIRTAEDKLGRDAGGDLALMAKESTRAWILDPSDPVTEAVWAAARTAHRALGCRDYSLFDFRIDPEGRPWFLEAGLYCSYAATSVVSMMAKSAGIGLPDLLAGSIGEALGGVGRRGM